MQGLMVWASIVVVDHLHGGTATWKRTFCLGHRCYDTKKASEHIVIQDSGEIRHYQVFPCYAIRHPILAYGGGTDIFCTLTACAATGLQTLWLVPPLQDPDWPVSQPNLVDLVLNKKVWAPMVLGFCFDRDPLKTQWSVHLC